MHVWLKFYFLGLYRWHLSLGSGPEHYQETNEVWGAQCDAWEGELMERWSITLISLYPVYQFLTLFRQWSMVGYA